MALYRILAGQHQRHAAVPHLAGQHHYLLLLISLGALRAMPEVQSPPENLVRLPQKGTVNIEVSLGLPALLHQHIVHIQLPCLITEVKHMHIGTRLIPLQKYLHLADRPGCPGFHRHSFQTRSLGQLHCHMTGMLPVRRQQLHHGQLQ